MFVQACASYIMLCVNTCHCVNFEWTHSKGSFYIAQYPVRWTAQSASHFYGEAQISHNTVVSFVGLTFRNTSNQLSLCLKPTLGVSSKLFSCRL